MTDATREQQRSKYWVIRSKYSNGFLRVCPAEVTLFVCRNRCTDMHTWTHWKTTIAVNRKSEGDIKAGVHQLWSDMQCIFKSCFLSQDTVVALQALSTFTGLVGSHDFDLTVKVETDPSTTVATFSIRQDNYMLHQSQQVLTPNTCIRKKSLKIICVQIKHL